MATTAIVVADPTKGIKVDAGIIAQPFRDEIKERVLQLRKHGIDAPRLVGLLAHRDDPAARQYAEWTGRACRADGLQYELRTLEDPIDAEAALVDANNDPRVHGIIVYYPIFGGGGPQATTTTFSGASQDDYLRDSVSHKCDVEGLCHLYRSNLYRNVRYLDHPTNTQKCLLPCTALSVVKILEAVGAFDKTKPVTKQLQGRTITIINRSEIVGRPLAALLANDGARVYSIDIDSIYRLEGGRLHPPDGTEHTPELCVRKSDIVVTGVPTKSYRLPSEWIKEGTIVVNVASFKNVDEEALLKIPRVIYVPQVGKVTVAMLERNMMRLFEQFHHPDVLYRHLLEKPKQLLQPWYGNLLNFYTAAAVTLLIALHVAK